MKHIIRHRRSPQLNSRQMLGGVSNETVLIVHLHGTRRKMPLGKIVFSAPTWSEATEPFGALSLLGCPSRVTRLSSLDLDLLLRLRRRGLLRQVTVGTPWKRSPSISSAATCGLRAVQTCGTTSTESITEADCCAAQALPHNITAPWFGIRNDAIPRSSGTGFNETRESD